GAQAPRERPRVDALDPDDVVLLHEALQVLVRAVVGGHAAELAHDEPLGVGLVGLHVVDADAVVADVRVGHRDDLPVVAGVGEDLLVAGHRGVEHDLADRLAAGPEGVALVDGAVLEGEDRAWLGEERHPSGHSTTRRARSLQAAYTSLHLHAPRRPGPQTHRLARYGAVSGRPDRWTGKP